MRTLLLLGGVLVLIVGYVVTFEAQSSDVPVVDPKPADTQPRLEQANILTAAEAADPVTGDEIPFSVDLAPGERMDVSELPDVDSGLLLPDGSHLPLLNGVPHAPRLKRFESDGPLPPVVAIMANPQGEEWYIHADGSQTTTAWRDTKVWDPETETLVPSTQVVTTHLVPVDESRAMGGETVGADPRGNSSGGSKKN